MAEAFARHLGGDLVEPWSAGLFPAAIIQPETFQAMAEREIPLADRRPVSVLLVDGSGYDLVVNMSGEPVARLLEGFTGREIFWEVADPIGTSMPIYRVVRDQIEYKVTQLLQELRTARDEAISLP